VQHRQSDIRNDMQQTWLLKQHILLHVLCKGAMMIAETTPHKCQQALWWSDAGPLNWRTAVRIQSFRGL